MYTEPQAETENWQSLNTVKTRRQHRVYSLAEIVECRVLCCRLEGVGVRKVLDEGLWPWMAGGEKRYEEGKDFEERVPMMRDRFVKLIF